MSETELTCPIALEIRIQGPKPRRSGSIPTLLRFQPLIRSGNEGIGIITGPGENDFDLSAVKNTYIIGERVNLQIRGEFFNAFNHANFGSPNTTFGTPQFGEITNTSIENRIVQLGAHLNF